MTPAEQAEIEGIRKREQAATEGPWTRANRDAEDHYNGVTRVVPIDQKTKACAAVCDSINNSDFIAHARTDIPFMLDLIDRQAKENEALRKASMDYLDAAPLVGDYRLSLLAVKNDALDAKDELMAGKYAKARGDLVNVLAWASKEVG